MKLANAFCWVECTEQYCDYSGSMVWISLYDYERSGRWWAHDKCTLFLYTYNYGVLVLRMSNGVVSEKNSYFNLNCLRTCTITQNKSLKITLSAVSEICLHSCFLEEFVSSWGLMSRQPCRVTSGWILTGKGFKWFSSFLALDGRVGYKLQALVYDILPSTTAVFSYATGSTKLSANEQCFFCVGAQTVISLLQTTQIKQGVSFIAANKVYTSTNKTTIVLIETELFFFNPGWVRLMFTCVLWR